MSLPRLILLHTLALLTIVAAFVLTGCASVRPDPGKYTTPTDHGTYTFDEKAYNAALAESKRKDWFCVLADAGTTVGGVALGLSESNPVGLIVIPVMLAVHKVSTERARDQGNDMAQKVENVAHCGAAALNVAVIAGAL